MLKTALLTASGFRCNATALRKPGRIATPTTESYAMQGKVVAVMQQVLVPAAGCSC